MIAAPTVVAAPTAVAAAPAMVADPIAVDPATGAMPAGVQQVVMNNPASNVSLAVPVISPAALNANTIHN